MSIFSSFSGHVKSTRLFLRSRKGGLKSIINFYAFLALLLEGGGGGPRPSSELLFKGHF